MEDPKKDFDKIRDYKLIHRAKVDVSDFETVLRCFERSIPVEKLCWKTGTPMTIKTFDNLDGNKIVTENNICKHFEPKSGNPN